MKNAIALLFPGQGSQEAGMGRELAEADSAAMQLWKRAESVSGLPLREIFWEGDEAAMSDTRALQPALTVVNLNLWRALAGRVHPVAAAGHSLGEFAALAAAGVLDEESVLQIVSLRGRLMAEADPDGRGGMAAILKLTLEQVEGLVREAAEESDRPLIIANYNTPGQYVISGDKEAVALACGKVRPLKGRAVELKVSGAFHSPLMEKANRELEPLLRKAVWRRPRFAVYANLHGRGLTDGESLKESLLLQMVSSVRWIETIRQQYADGVRCWLELGPKAVLGKMVGQCLDQLDEAARAELRVMLVNSCESLENFNI